MDGYIDLFLILAGALFLLLTLKAVFLYRSQKRPIQLYAAIMTLLIASSCFLLYLRQPALAIIAFLLGVVIALSMQFLFKKQIQQKEDQDLLAKGHVPFQRFPNSLLNYGFPGVLVLFLLIFGVLMLLNLAMFLTMPSLGAHLFIGGIVASLIIAALLTKRMVDSKKRLEKLERKGD
jgi:hypothetical protein